MARPLISLLSFNRGLISRLGLARIDLKRTALSAQVMTNWMPRVLGAMSIRPGLQFIGTTLANSAARFLPFVFSTSDTALIEFTDSAFRVWVADALVTRAAVATTVTNGTFAIDLSGWTDNSMVGGITSWVAPNYMQLTSDGTASAIRDQQVTVAAGDLNVEHALRIVIARGPVTLRVGSSQGDDSYIGETVLNTGTHSLALTPSGNIFIRFLSQQIPVVWVDQCTVEPAGVMTLPSPYLNADLGSIRSDQSADVVFIACFGYQQRRVERRSTHSWSIVTYTAPDGPFRVQNINNNTIAASALTGNVTLTASVPTFKSTHVGALFSLTSTGQEVSQSISAQNVWSSPISVTGVGTTRAVAINITGTFVATISLQRSVGSSFGPWVDVASPTWTTPSTASYNDTLDNQLMYYRIGIKTGNYTSGTALVSLSIATGSITGIARVTGFTSNTSVSAEVLIPFGANAGATSDWAEGEWSDFRGWPSCVSFHDGRLWWAGKGKVWASVSDAYNSFDATVLGDAGTISRSIGSGPVDIVNWLLSMQRLMMGAQGSEITISSTALGETVTPSNFNMRAGSTQGSGATRPVKIDQHGVFVNRTGIKVFELSMGTNYPFYDYIASDMMALVPEIGRPGITRMDVQRQPDTRIHCVRSDGIAIVAISDKDEDVLAWVQVQTDGIIEDVVTLPALAGDIDDQVYYVVNRTINGATVRYLEKWAQEVDCRGDLPLCNLADSFISQTFVYPTSTVTGLGTLEGQQVVVWADGADVGTDDSVTPWAQLYTVVGGQIVLAAAASNVVVGLPYTAQFQSSKLGEATQDVPSPLNTQKKINHLGLIMANVHSKGVCFGADFNDLDDLPSTVNGVDIGQVILTDYDENPSEFPGIWDTDCRLCLQAQAPRPCTILAATLDMEQYK